MHTIIKCLGCGNDTSAKRKDRVWCSDCYKEHHKELRRIRDRGEIAKARYKRYRKTEKYIVKARERYYKLEYGKRMARSHVCNAIRDGVLKRPSYCARCGIKDWGKKRSMIEANHYKGYDKQNWLVVEWLCTNCHKKADKFI